MRRSLFLLASVMCAGCMAPTPPPPPPVVQAAPPPAIGKWGVDLGAMDTSVKPGDDFFMYVNGNWLKTAQIPADRASTGSFQNLRIQSEKRMSEIVAGLEASGGEQLQQGRCADAVRVHDEDASGNVGGSWAGHAHEPVSASGHRHLNAPVRCPFTLRRRPAPVRVRIACCARGSRPAPQQDPPP